MQSSSVGHLRPRNAESLLREAGLRSTAPRRAVLNVLADSPHATADDVVRESRSQHPRISPQTVYGVLHALTDAGLVRRIEPAGSPARYENRAGDNHHHVVCRDCGQIADVDCLTGQRPCLEAADDSGYLLDEAEIIFWGRCPECRRPSIASQGRTA